MNTYRQHIPPELEARFRKISELQKDWNSYGAAPISPWAIDQARSLVNTAMSSGLPAPAVSPAAGASVSIEWQTQSSELIIDVDPHHGTTYLIADRDNGNGDNGDSRPNIEGDLNDHNLLQILNNFLAR